MLKKVVALVGLAFSLSTNAAVIVTAVESNGDVVLTASGTLDLTGLTLVYEGGASPLINPSLAALTLGPGGLIGVDGYTGLTAFPADIGPGFGKLASAGAGDMLLVGSPGFSGQPPGSLGVPDGYISNTALSSSASFNNETLVTLGLSPGTYTWEWSSDSVTLEVTSVPIPAATWLFGSALLGLGVVKRRKA